MMEIKFEMNLKRSAAYDGLKECGECCFSTEGNIWIINHTFVDPSYGGQGIARKLLDCVIEKARKQGVKINPVCSYAVHQFEKNPDLYADLKA